MEEYINSQNQELTKDFELAHIIGINTKIPNCVQAHTVLSETVSYSVGGLLIVEDLNEKNNQVYFRHGTNQINCFKLSNTGKYIAVGFISNILEKKLPTPIIVWDTENKTVLFELTGIFKGITHIEFSQDDKYILSCGLDNSIFIWDMKSGERVFSRIFEFPITCAFWTTIFLDSTHKYPSYTITLANIHTVTLMTQYFELKTMKYNFKTDKLGTPLGFSRTYTCGVYDKVFNMIYLGATTGELVLFDVGQLSFKYSFSVIYNGVTSITLLKDSSLIVGGGDGKVKKLIIDNNKHLLTHEIQLLGKINSLSLITDEKEVVCCTSLGYLYRILVNDLTYTLHSFSHSSSVNDCAYFNQRENDKIITVEDNVILN
jgi:WD40 repeat protein